MKTTCASVDQMYETNQRFRETIHLLPMFDVQRNLLTKRMQSLGWTPRRIRMRLETIKNYMAAEAVIHELGAEIVPWPVTLDAEQLRKARMGVR